VHFEKLLFGVDHQLVINTDLAKLLLDRCDSEPVLFGQRAAEQPWLEG
jgi:hypothetical protein